MSVCVTVLWFLLSNSHQVIDQLMYIRSLLLWIPVRWLMQLDDSFLHPVTIRSHCVLGGIAQFVFEMNRCCLTLERFVIRALRDAMPDRISESRCLTLAKGTLVHARATSALTNRRGLLLFSVGGPRACLTTGPAHKILPRPQTRYGPGKKKSLTVPWGTPLTCL